MNSIRAQFEKKNVRIPLFKVFMPPEATDMMVETLNSGFLAEGVKVAAFADQIAQFVVPKFLDNIL